jgi:polysaccharide biosynthesis/export protein
MKKIAWLGLVFFTLILAACASSKKVTMPPITDRGVLEEYRIGVGDALQINVWRNPELSTAVPVRPDGKISLPLVGDIMAANLTTVQLSSNIIAGLENYVRNPQVTVIVANPSSSDFLRRVRITGAVRSPQSLPYRDGMTVLDLVLLAGGPNEFASPNKAKLYRKVNGETKVYPIYLSDLIENGKVETNYPLQPSDIVTVPERSF